jgi:hypothetical protein
MTLAVSTVVVVVASAFVVVTAAVVVVVMSEVAAAGGELGVVSTGGTEEIAGVVCCRCRLLGRRTARNDHGHQGHAQPLAVKPHSVIIGAPRGFRKDYAVALLYACRMTAGCPVRRASAGAITGTERASIGRYCASLSAGPEHYQSARARSIESPFCSHRSTDIVGTLVGFGHSAIICRIARSPEVTLNARC